jgi:hypothetical protein
MISPEGYPFYWRVLDGSTQDVTTIEALVDDVRKRFGIEDLSYGNRNDKKKMAKHTGNLRTTAEWLTSLTVRGTLARKIPKTGIKNCGDMDVVPKQLCP